MSLRFVCALGLVTSVCGASSCASRDSGGLRENAGESAAAIQGGTDDHGDSFAVGICGGLPGACKFICSGTLIAPNLVVSARHCVQAIDLLDPQTGTVDCASSTFGAPIGAPSDFYVTTDFSMLQATRGWHQVVQIVTPTPTKACGNDLSLLVLKDVISSSEATPATPAGQYPITDHSRYSTTETTIGYGLTGPSSPSTYGLRRTLQNIHIQCIPLDPDPTLDCYKISAGAPAFIAENEFQAGNGTCAGDSGASAFEQLSFNAGKPVSLGVLSRGGTDATNCLSAVYTRLDKWRELIVQTAQAAAAQGGYTAPEWTQPTPIEPDAGSNEKDAAAPGALGSACKVENDCTSRLCVTVPDSSPAAYVCSQACSDAIACPSGFICENDACFAGTVDAIDAGAADGAASLTNADTASSGGCAIATRSERTDRVPWSLAAGAIVAGASLVRRRRRRHHRATR